MCSKFIKLIVLLSLLVCCGFAGRVLYSRFVQSFSRTRERSTSHPDQVQYTLDDSGVLQDKSCNKENGQP